MASKAKNVNWGGLTLVCDRIVTGKATSAAGENVTLPSKGTVTTSGTTVAEETIVGDEHIVKLTLTDFAIGTSGDAAALALGASLYTMPAGDKLVEGSSIIGAVTAAISVTTDTPEIGLGTVAGTGVNATLGAQATTTENIGGPFVLTNVAGNTATDGGVGAASNTTGLLVPTADSGVVYLNLADTWADVTAAGACTFTGVVTLKYRVI